MARRRHSASVQIQGYSVPDWEDAPMSAARSTPIHVSAIPEGIAPSGSDEPAPSVRAKRGHLPRLRRGRTKLGLAAAVSALALMASACETAPSPEQLHMRDWQMAARADNPVAYSNYIRIYPDGQYVSVAQQRIAELKQQEGDAFDIAKRAGTEQAYQDFLARYPWGMHVAEADQLRARA